MGMRRKVAGVLAAASMCGLAACANSEVSSVDAYRIGCPTLDAALAGGSVANKAGVAALRKLSEQPELGAEARQWLAAAAPVLENANADDLPADTKALLVDGCADNGFPLKNLR